MEIFKNFGVEWSLTFAQIVNFLIIFYILKRYLYRPLFNVLKKRETTIKEGLAKAEEGKKALEKALLEEKKIIKNAKDTATQIVKEAREQSDTLVKHAEEEAKKKADRMIEDAKIQIERESRNAEVQLAKNITRLSVELLRKSLTDIFSEKEQTEIVSRAVKVLEKRPN